MLFNYGAFPQTHESPRFISPDTVCPGDNDPVDVVEVGVKRWDVGSVVRVKVLGVLGLIDSGETDWKVIAISAEDPLAPVINDLPDLEVHMPGTVEALTRWLRLYKAPLINEFAFGGEARGKEYAETIIEECHQMWQDLVEGEGVGSSGGGAAAGHGGHGNGQGGAEGPLSPNASRPQQPSIVSAGLTRSSSHSKLAEIFGTAPSSSPQPARASLGVRQ